MTQYATLAQLYVYGAPSTAFGQISDADKNSQLQAASDVVDSYLRGRYLLPLLTYGLDITEATCKIAAYLLLAGTRGYNPGAQADSNIRTRYDDAISWLKEVQKQQAHPNVTPRDDTTPSVAQPAVYSSSVVDLSTGATAPNRGW